MTEIYVLWDNFDGGQIIGVFDTFDKARDKFLEQLNSELYFVEKAFIEDERDEEDFDDYLTSISLNLNKMKENKCDEVSYEGISDTMCQMWYLTTITRKEVK